MSLSILAVTTEGLCILSAQQQTNNVAGWLDRARLSGEWNGARTSMENSGVDFSAHFVTESAMNPVGGFRQTARYTQQIDFGVDLECL